jgi:hypothetical protein
MPSTRPVPKPARTRLAAETLDARVMPSGTGLTREVWSGLAGTSLAPLTAAIANGVVPTAVGTIGADGLFEAPRNAGDNYGQRVRGYFEAPVTGEYRFYLAADDHAELRLSTDETPANARVIASVSGYTGFRQWTKFTSQASAPIALVAGERYYVEALHKEGRGADNLAVRVDVPGAAPSALPASAGLFDAFAIAPPPNAAPVVAVAPAPVAVTGTSAPLSALGADDGGEAGLRYTWSVAGKPTGAADPTFASNGTNAAKATTVTFWAAGSYTLRLTVTDAQGLTATRYVPVTVAQTLTQIAVAPGSVSVSAGGTRQFTATARDQFGAPLATAPAFQWVAAGAGTISGSGLFTAGASGGSATVRARVGSVTSPAVAVTVAPPAAGGDWYSRNLIDDELVGLTRSLAADGQLSRLDWLGILSSVQDNNVVDADEVTDLQKLVVAVPLFTIPDPTRWLANRIATDAVANMLGTTFQTELVGRWFLGTVAPTPVFNGRAFTYAVASGNLYGSTGRPRIGDIDQGGLGDCAFLAALGATFGRQRDDSGNATSSVIENMITDNGDGTYTFRFSRFEPSTATTRAEYVTVDRRIYAGGAKRNGGVFWVALTERAYAQYLEFQKGVPGYNVFGNGDSLGAPLLRVTGRQPAYLDPTGPTFFSQLQSALGAGRHVSTARLGANTQYVVGGHAYSITDAYVDPSGVQRIVVRNPWGVDGRATSGSSNDGFIDLTLEQFRANMNYGVNVA